MTAEVIAAGEKRAEETVGGPARLRVVLILAAILALDTADKATVSAVAGSLKDAFDIGNAQIGILIAAVSFIGAVFTLPFGVLVDRIRRTRILVVAIAVWGIAMLVSGLANSFAFMLCARIFLGAVTATAAPAVASLTGDFFPARERASMYGIILAGEMAGAGVGFFVSGEVSSFLDWRWPFFVMALPAFALAFVIWRYLPEPARGGQSWIMPGEREVRSQEDVEEGAEPPPEAEQDTAEAGASAHVQEEIMDAGVKPHPDLVLTQDPSKRSLWWVLRYVLKIPTYVLLVIASALGYYFFAGIRAFGFIYLTEHWDVSRALLSGLLIVIGIGGLAGVTLGGRLSEYFLSRKYHDIRITLPGIAMVLAVCCFAPAIWTTSLILGVALLTLGALFLAAANPSIDAARLDIIVPTLWGRAEAGRMALRALLEGAAPMLFGFASGWLGGGESGLKWTFLIMLIPLIIAASLAIPGHRTYLRDVATAGKSAERLARKKDS
ncbi:MFS transporter [Jiella sp. M17.18]|uniref:MFS transporter n=1 Tax=Jiella sp. M17.18 TaxID=3234247 RepID=UPI0034DEE01E